MTNCLNWLVPDDTSTNMSYFFMVHSGIKLYLLCSTQVFRTFFDYLQHNSFQSPQKACLTEIQTEKMMNWFGLDFFPAYS